MSAVYSSQLSPVWSITSKIEIFSDYDKAFPIISPKSWQYFNIASH